MFFGFPGLTSDSNWINWDYKLVRVSCPKSLTGCITNLIVPVKSFHRPQLICLRTKCEEYDVNILLRLALRLPVLVADSTSLILEVN